MTKCMIWVAYNSMDDCFASHEGAHEAIEGLVEAFGYGEGARVVELQLDLPSAKPIAATTSVPEDASLVSVMMK